MKRLFRISVAVMLVVFVSWAGFQYNDSDALLWILVYGSAALGCLLYLLGAFPRRLAWTYVVACVAGALYLAVRVAVAGEFFFEEQGREGMGLLICAGWIAFLARRERVPSADVTS